MTRLFAVQLKDAPAERYEQWVNTPVYTRDYEDCIGWLGCELPDDGHSCEFAELAGDGAVTCVSSSKVNRLQEENAKLRELLSMYVSFARAFAEGCILHRAYCDGMGKRMDETKMRERALELGVKECR